MADADDGKFRVELSSGSTLCLQQSLSRAAVSQAKGALCDPATQRGLQPGAVGCTQGSPARTISRVITASNHSTTKSSLVHVGGMERTCWQSCSCTSGQAELGALLPNQGHTQPAGKVSQWLNKCILFAKPRQAQDQHSSEGTQRAPTGSTELDLSDHTPHSRSLGEIMQNECVSERSEVKSQE